MSRITFQFRFYDVCKRAKINFNTKAHIHYIKFFLTFLNDQRKTKALLKNDSATFYRWGLRSTAETKPKTSAEIRRLGLSISSSTSRRWLTFVFGKFRRNEKQEESCGDKKINLGWFIALSVGQVWLLFVLSLFVLYVLLYLFSF